MAIESVGCFYMCHFSSNEFIVGLTNIRYLCTALCSAYLQVFVYTQCLITKHHMKLEYIQQKVKQYMYLSILIDFKHDKK